MGVEILGKVGKQTLSNGSPATIRLGTDGSVSTVSPEHMINVLDGNVYIGSNLGGTPVTTQAGLSATTPALTLYNPVGSGVNLVLLTADVTFTAAPAAACGVMLAYNALNATPPATTTDANMTNCILGSTAAPKGRCYRIATLAAAPLACRFLGGTTGAAAISGFQIVEHIDGQIVIPPGVAMSVQTTSAAAILASFTWMEVNI